MRLIGIFLLAVSLVCLTSWTATAAAINGYGSPLNDPQLVGGVPIDFQSAPAGDLTSISVGPVTFATPAAQPLSVISQHSGKYNVSGRYLNLPDNSNPSVLLTITFARPVDAFAFNFGASNFEWGLDVFDAGNQLLGSRTIPVTYYSNAGDYFGMAVAGISSARLSCGAGDHVLLDNFAYREAAVTAAPEPASVLSWIALGLAACAAVGRRRG